MIPANGRAAHATTFLADDDLLLIAAAFAEDVAPEELAEFDRRYLEDPAWRARVQPLVGLFLLPVDWARVGDEIDCAADARMHDKTQARERRNQRILFTMKTAAILAAIAVLGATAIQIAALTWLVDEGPDRVIGMTPVHKEAGAAAPAPLGRGGKTAHPDSVRASVAMLANLDIRGRTAAADSGMSIVLELPGGSRLRARPGSTVRYASLTGIARASLLELRGEAAIVVTKADVVVGVASRAGRALLFPGSYAVRCVAICEALEVTTQEGSALIANDWHPGTKLTVSAGEFGRAFRDAPPVKVTGPATAKFPAPDSTLRRTP